jgi:hypothetical protein
VLSDNIADRVRVKCGSLDEAPKIYTLTIQGFVQRRRDSKPCEESNEGACTKKYCGETRKGK